MKPSLYLFSVTFICFAFSCNKKEETKPYNPEGAYAAKLKSVTNSQTAETITYSYLADGKIQLQQNSTGSKTTFEYNANNVIETEYDKTGALIKIKTITLDSLGLQQTAVVTDANANVLGFEEYTFDSEKHKTSELHYTAAHAPNGKIEWVWSNGNNIEYAVYDSAVDHKTYDVFYWYYDPAVTSFGNTNTGKNFLGADSKYLLRKQVGYVYGGANVVYSYEYTSDDQQRITERRTYSYTGTLKATETFSYY